MLVTKCIRGGCTGTAALELIIYVHQAAVGLAVTIHDVVRLQYQSLELMMMTNSQSMMNIL